VAQASHASWSSGSARACAWVKLPPWFETTIDHTSIEVAFIAACGASDDVYHG
jgi:hypothetical protein